MFQLPVRLPDDLRRAGQALAQDRNLLRPDAQPRRLLHQEHDVRHLHHAQEDGAGAEQGVLRTLRVFREFCQAG